MDPFHINDRLYNGKIIHEESSLRIAKHLRSKKISSKHPRFQCFLLRLSSSSIPDILAREQNNFINIEDFIIDSHHIYAW